MSNRNPRNHQLLSQIADGNKFKKMLARAFDLPDDLERDIEAVGLRRDLSAEGKQQATQKHLRKTLRDLRDLKKPLQASPLHVHSLFRLFAKESL